MLGRGITNGFKCRILRFIAISTRFSVPNRSFFMFVAYFKAPIVFKLLSFDE